MKNMSEIEEQCRTYCNHIPKFNIDSESIKKLGEKLKKTRVEATKFYGGDSEEPYLTLEREVEEEPTEPSWLEEISMLSEESINAIKFYLDSGIFTLNEMKTIVHGFVERTRAINTNIANTIQSENASKLYENAIKHIKETSLGSMT